MPIPPQVMDQRVAIVMGLHDAGDTLRAQLDSYLDQSWPHWDLHIGDDGASAQDLAHIDSFRQKAGQGHGVTVTPGPKQGFVRNYMRLLCDLPADTAFAALSDQDDIWLPAKLERALAALHSVSTPALYCGARLIWNPVTDRRGPSRLLRRAPSFRNALVENIATGNTIVLNRAALDLIRRSPPEAGAVFAHDWWLYLLITGAGGQVIHDPDPQILYRQHGANLVGAGEVPRNWIAARLRVAGGDFRGRVDRNIAALDAARDLLTVENRALLDRFAAARRASLPARLRRIGGLGLYRQDRLSQLGLWGALALARI